MPKFLYSILLVACIGVALVSCTTGAYDNNTSSPANQSINPLNPLKVNQFTWSGSAPFSAEINGAEWVADTVWASIDTSGAGNFFALQYAKSSGFWFHYPNSWSGNLYNMGYQQARFAMFTDSLGFISYNDSSFFYSYLGNSGEFYLEKNVFDTLIAKFYFQGINSRGQLINITNGYIDMEIP